MSTSLPESTSQPLDQVTSYQILSTSLLESTSQHLDSVISYQKVLTRIIAKIRRSAPLESLCSTTCQDIAQLLDVDRVALYRFNADYSGKFINCFGYASSPWDSLTAFGEELVWEDTHLQQTKGGRYLTNEPFAVADVYAAGHSRCHIEVLEQFQIRAYAIAPIFVGAKLWGLFAAYQHSGVREWDSYEVEFLAQAAGHIGVAIQQAELLEQSKQQTADLENSLARQRALSEVVNNIRSSLDTNFIFHTTCQDLCKLLKLERAAIYRFNPDWSGEFISHFGRVEPQWERANPFGQNLVWEDTHLQETKGGRYRNNETFAVNDIYAAGHTRCHLDVLEQFKIRAYVLVPIFTGSKLWGLLAAYQHSSSRQWAAFEVEFLSQAGAQLGVAIQQANLLKHTKQQSIAFQNAIARQRALTEVVSKIRSSLDPTLILETTCQEVCNQLKVERVAVFRFNEDWNGEFVSHFGDSSWASLKGFGKNLIWEDTYLQETKGGRYRNNEHFAVADIYEAGHSRCHIEILEQFKIRAYALTPIFVGRNLWGLLAAYQHSAPREWDTVEVEFLGQVANQLGVAIQSAELLSKTQIRAEELHQSAEQSRILFDVVSKIRESLDLETIFTTMVTEVRRSLKADRVGVYKFDSDSAYNEGEFVAEDVLPKFPAALGAKVRDHCFGENYATKYSKGRMHTMTDLRCAEIDECYRSILEQFEIRAVIIAPIIKDGTLWGLLCVHQCEYPREWSHLDIQFVKQVAAQLSIALKQSDLLAQTREQTERLEQTLTDLKKAQIQIVQSEKMASLGQLVAGVAHEINNPVNFIHGNLQHAEVYVKELLDCVQLYQKHYPNPVEEIQEFLDETELSFLFEDIPKLLGSMNAGTERIQEIVASLRNFSRLDEAEMKQVNIHDGIDSTLMILQNRLKPVGENSGIRIIKDYDEIPLVECYPGQLNQVFMNLLANSIDALEEFNEQRSAEEIQANSSTIRISTMKGSDRTVAIYISDNGPGITEVTRASLFDPFFTTKPVGKGTGLGLSISYQIVTEKHGGKLTCNSTMGEGAEFIIEIPIHQSDATSV
ncbi:GAF domain-containing protein [Pseudanabaenaceae cyanobacterium LEGE 13415]|nr:GAF domain-containing protein [Pseudanabaenaceae cyanobacterium LEGE 13415]